MQLSSYAEKIRVVQEENDAVCKVHQIRKLQKYNSEVRMFSHLVMLAYMHCGVRDKCAYSMLTCDIAVGAESAKY